MAIYSYQHSGTSLASIEAGLSKNRLQKYLDFADGDTEKALELHSWNCALGAALHPPIQHFELVLRNACHRELQSIFGQADWFNVLPGGPELTSTPVTVAQKNWFLELLDNIKKQCCGCHPDKNQDEKKKKQEITTWDYLNTEITTVKERLGQAKRDPNHPPCVVAALSFGFWVVLFTKKLDQQFYRAGSGKGLYKIAPNQPACRKPRHAFHARLERIKGLRNRIAHHEPLFHRNLEAAHKLILETTEYINKDSANWSGHHSTFLEIWNAPPLLTPAQLRRLQLNQSEDNYFNP